MVKGFWQRLACAVGCGAALLAGVNKVHAEDPPAGELQERIERLERQNQELLEAFQYFQRANPNNQPTRSSTQPSISPGSDSDPVPPRLPESLRNVISSTPVASQSLPIAVSPEDVRKIVNDYLAGKEEEKRVAEEIQQANGVVVANDNKINVSWDEGGFRFKSANESFSVHFGGRLMTDQVWFDQSAALQKSATPPAGSPLLLNSGVGPGIGDLPDGFFLRRARVVADGYIFQTVEFKVEFDFENYNSISFDESFVGFKDLPFIQTVRFGQMHVPFGLEAYTSSRFLPMLERSPLFDAFYQEFGPGIFSNTTFFDERMTTQHMFHRIDNFSQFNGASFGDGKYAYSGRVSFLPIFEDDGRYLLHLAMDYQWRKGSNPADFNGGTVLASTPSPLVTTNTDLVRFRTRQSIRDAVGLQGNNTRIVDTGNIIADDVQSFNPELLWYCGPAWVQAETCLAHVDNAFLPASSKATKRGDLNFCGTYVQVGCFLTPGDKRGYDRRMGKHSRVHPLQNFFLVRDEDGRFQYGLGAWELVYRYGYVNLDNNSVQGGRYGEHTVGVNWYWNSNIKFQLNYINGQRDVPAGASGGIVQGLGIRAALEF